MTNPCHLLLRRAFVLGLCAAAPAWTAEVAAPPVHDSGGWAISNGRVVSGPQGAGEVRLELRVDRGLADLSRTVPVAAGRDYELRIDYRSTTPESTRDRGSWLYLSFRDDQAKGISDTAVLFEPTAEWKARSVHFAVPVGAAKTYMSFRQQQKAGVFEIRAIELLPSDPAAKVELGPSALAALAWLAVPGEKLSPDGERSPSDGDIFQPYLKGKAPGIVREVGSELIDGVQVRRVVFRSLLVGGEPQDVYAIIARPAREGEFPGLVSLHGGWWCADEPSTIRLAKAGYVAIAPDLPGIADPKRCPNSVGPWAKRWGMSGWTANPDPTADGLFDAVVAALQAFDLLVAQPGVIKDRVGVTGISMGGYTTTMISGLLGRRVRAAYSKFGCGFYERGSEWAAGLRNMPDDQRDAWLRHFDAGRRAPGIQAPFFIAAAVRDHFFWPPAVNSTLAAVPSGGNLAYAHVVTHRLEGIPGEEGLDLLYLGYWLKGEGKPFPKVAIEDCAAQADGGRRVVFSALAPMPIQTATLYVTAGGDGWEASTWAPLAALPVGGDRFQAVIPADRIGKRGAWFVSVSDARPATASSCVYGTQETGAGPTLRPVGCAPR